MSNGGARFDPPFPLEDVRGPAVLLPIDVGKPTVRTDL